MVNAQFFREFFKCLFYFCKLIDARRVLVTLLVHVKEWEFLSVRIFSNCQNVEILNAQVK